MVFWSRRQLFRASATGLAGSSAAFSWGWAGQAASPAVSSRERAALEPLNRFPRMVQEYFVERVRAVEQAGHERRARLQTRTDAEAYIQEVRKKIGLCFGPWPEKTPLNPRTTGVVERDAYRIENIIFESRPGFLVTANLYLPKGRSFPLPGVVGSCGHSSNGKAAEAYQSFAQGLARMGYVVLIFDPLGQGERLQYGGQPGTREHFRAGCQQVLVGEFLGSWRAWDGIRALDYLLSRPEVDSRHVGVTGNSGGGTMTTWLCGVEPRWTMAAPSCFVTTFRRNLENELAADPEQCPPQALALGLDHADFIAAMAPKPVILLGKERDYFDARGLEEAYQRLRHIYRLLGAEQNIALFIGPTEHGYSRENREAMYGWFNRITGLSPSSTEPALTIEKDETLWCAPGGQVSQLRSRTIFSFTAEKAARLAAARPERGEQDLDRAIRASLRLPLSGRPPEFRILRPRSGREYPLPHALSYAVESEPGAFALVHRLSQDRLLSRPPRETSRALLYVSHLSSDAELREEPLIRELLTAEPQAAFFACDLRGIGDSRPDTGSGPDLSNLFGSDYFHAVHALMLDYPTVGQRTHDLLRVLEWLHSYGHTEVHLAALGWGTVPATFAAILAEQVRQVTLKQPPASYRAIAEAERYEWPLSAFLPNVLASFDLPDCYRRLEGKALRLIDPQGAVPAWIESRSGSRGAESAPNKPARPWHACRPKA